MLDLRTHESDGLEELQRGHEVKLCGVFSGIQRRRNKEGRPWASMVLEDWLGTVDLVCFAKHFEQLEAQIKEDEAVLVTGSVLPEENGPPKISVLDIVPLKNAFVKFPLLVSVRVPVEPGKQNGESRAARLRDLFTRKPGDTEVQLIVEKRGEYSATMTTTLKVKPDREFKTEVARLCGDDACVISGGF